MKTSIETIGPKTAQKYLEARTLNRALNKSKVNTYAAAMSAGNWKTNHQGIALDETGRLIDGQHRLNAIVQSGKSVRMQVTRYELDSPMETFDSGISRTIGDRCQISGIIPEHGRMNVAMIVAMGVAESGTQTIGYSKLQPHEVGLIYKQEKSHLAIVIKHLGAHLGTAFNSYIRAALAYCHGFAPKEVEELLLMLKEKHGYKKGSAAHAFVSALADGKLRTKDNSDVVAMTGKVLWLIRQHIEGNRVERIRPNDSIFNWARRQREELGTCILPLIRENTGEY